MRASASCTWLVAAIAAVLVASACPGARQDDDVGDDDDDAPAGEVLDDTTRQALAAVLPQAARGLRVPIPAALLDAEDLEAENDALLELLDAQGQRVGVLRDIFTPVHCVSGVCRAIRFVLVYDVARTFVEVYHPADDSHPLMKYRDNLHSEFDAQDMELLRGVLRAPPAGLLGLGAIEDLVVGVTETAPTRLEYQDLVVRGAAFTTYEILMYHVETRALLAEVLP